jgi:integrase
MSKPRRQRHQTGYIFSTGKGWSVRYRDASGKQCSEFLHARDKDHPTKSCKAVLNLRDAYMAKVNAATVQPEGEVDICAFWTATFLPLIVRAKKPSTIESYKRLWVAYCEPNFKGRTFGKYRTKHGRDLLTSLVPRLNRNSLSHVRSLCSGLFREAVNEDIIQRNPWREVIVSEKVRPPKVTPHYTLKEIGAVISACAARPDAQVALGLAFFAGMRPGEIEGLMWEDIGTEFIEIKRSSWNRIIGTTKTEGSSAKVPIARPLKALLENYRAQLGGVTSGFVLISQRSGPADIKAFARHVIRPMVLAAGLPWKTLYGARRGVATALTELQNGNLLGAQGLLRHDNQMTTAQFYQKPVPAATIDGIKLLEASVENSKDKIR